MTEADTNFVLWKATDRALSRVLDAIPTYVLKNRISHVKIDDGNFTIRSSADIAMDLRRLSIAFNLKSEVNGIDVWAEIGKVEEVIQEALRKSFRSSSDRRMQTVDNCVEFLAQCEQEIKRALARE